MFQITLKDIIEFKGIGLHTGKIVNIRLIPAEENTGILFCRTDIPKSSFIPARYDFVRDTKLCTMLIDDFGVSIGTIEHLMSALAALGIDNLIIELNGPEVPILDGSSYLFIESILKCGLKEQLVNKKILKIIKPLELKTDNWEISCLPNKEFKVNLTIDFNNKIIGKQTYNYSSTKTDYVKEISKSRTFGQLEEINYLRSQGLGLGGSLKNAIIVDKENILNPEGLRYKDEFIRHKILDAIGDLYLSGYNICGEIIGYKTGHEANNELLRLIFKNPQCYVIEESYFPEHLLYLNYPVAINK